jgi:hypothetical protein
MIAATNWHLHSDCKTPQIYSLTLLTCDFSLSSPTLSVPEAGDFVELIMLYYQST